MFSVVSCRRKNAIILRTQLSVRVHACIGKSHLRFYICVDTEHAIFHIFVSEIEIKLPVILQPTGCSVFLHLFVGILQYLSFCKQKTVSLLGVFPLGKEVAN